MSIIYEALAKLEKLDVTIPQATIFANLVKIYTEAYDTVRKTQNRQSCLEFLALHPIMLKFLNKLYLMFNPAIDATYKNLEAQLNELYFNVKINYIKKEAFFADLSKLVH